MATTDPTTNAPSWVARCGCGRTVLNAGDRCDACDRKHTPGPWVADKRWIRPQDGTINNGIAIVLDWPAHNDTVADANARLLAAAPDLLAALNKIVDAAEARYSECGSDNHPAIAAARAAIAKATGDPVGWEEIYGQR